MKISRPQNLCPSSWNQFISTYRFVYLLDSQSCNVIKSVYVCMRVFGSAEKLPFVRNTFTSLIFILPFNGLKMVFEVWCKVSDSSSVKRNDKKGGRKPRKKFCIWRRKTSLKLFILLVRVKKGDKYLRPPLYDLFRTLIYFITTQRNIQHLIDPLNSKLEITNFRYFIFHNTYPLRVLGKR